MKLTIDCPNGVYAERMQIWCNKADNWCGHQYFKQCKGWWALSPQAKTCTLRRDDNEGSQSNRD